MDLNIKKKITELTHAFAGSHLYVNDAGNYELGIKFDDTREVLLRINRGSDSGYYDVDLILKFQYASYIYIVSELDLDCVNKEFGTILLIIKSFENKDYRIDSARVVLFWRRYYLVVNTQGQEIWLLRTKIWKR